MPDDEPRTEAQIIAAAFEDRVKDLFKQFAETGLYRRAGARGGDALSTRAGFREARAGSGGGDRERGCRGREPVRIVTRQRTAPKSG